VANEMLIICSALSKDLLFAAIAHYFVGREQALTALPDTYFKGHFDQFS
jgi:hypothetical protein